MFFLFIFYFFVQFFFLMIRRPPRSTLFPTRRSSDLVIELGRHDRGQELACFHPVADIDVALIDVAAGTGEDVGGGEGRRRAGQADDPIGLAGPHRADTDGRHEVAPLLGGCHDLAILRKMAPRAGRDGRHERQQNADTQHSRCPAHVTASSKTPCDGLPSLPDRSLANSQGTTSSVVGVANIRPPMTARASAAFCSSPVPPIAMGIMPTI